VTEIFVAMGVVGAEGTEGETVWDGRVKTVMLNNI
jgi:hypothetical protein